MSMKKCKECGASVSSGAKSCPSCGKDQRIFFAKHKLITFILILLIIIIIAVNSGDDSVPRTTLTSTSGNIEGDSSIQTNDKTKIYSVGEVYQDYSIAIKYVALNDNFTQYSKYAEVKSGYKVIQAEFEAENLSTTDEHFSSYDFNCYADGYDCESFWSVDDSSFGATLSTGKKGKGKVYFMVPKDAQEITIEYDINSFTGEKVKFKVK